VYLENEMETALIFVMGSICGISIYRGLTILLGATQSVLMFRRAEYMCLQLLALSLEDAANIKRTKQMIIEKLEYPDNVIKLTRNEDAYNLSAWKQEAIKRLIDRYPPNYRKIVQYRNWNEAMNYFEKQRKNICILED
tara:strand:- start:267 stop:680 length:414 start_codon:yes stop_codon:yes gene_type:complete